MKIHITSLLIALLVCASVALADIPESSLPEAYVSQETCSEVELGTTDSPYCEIQSGVDNVVTGGVVFVDAGVYEESVSIEIPLTLVSQGGSSVTFIEGGITVGGDDFEDDGPIIINGFTITDAEDAIYVYEVTEFTIINNNISSASNGIYLSETGGSEDEYGRYGPDEEEEDVQLLGFIRNNHIHNVGTGIYIYDSGDILVKNNIIEDTVSETSGVEVYESWDVFFEDNIVINNELGFDIDYSLDIYLTSNNISENSIGAQIEDSYNVYLDRNTIGNNELYGVFIQSDEEYTDVSFEQNEIFGSNALDGTEIGEAAGVYAEYSTVYMDGDDIFDNYYGVYVAYGDDSLYIEDTNIYSNEFGMYVYSSYTESDRNNIHNNAWGIYGTNGANIDSEDDNVFSNTEAGFYVGDICEEDCGEVSSSDLYISDATIRNNDVGISVYNDYLDAYDNNIRNNNQGLYVGSGNGGEAQVTIYNSNIVGNDEGLVTGGEESSDISAEDNYWGCPNGPEEGFGCDSSDEPVEDFLCIYFEFDDIENACSSDTGVGSFFKLLWGLIFDSVTDTDDDGLSDDDEINVFGTDPTNPDTDGDGLLDGAEDDPTDPDANNNGVTDGVDPDYDGGDAV